MKAWPWPLIALAVLGCAGCGANSTTSSEATTVAVLTNEHSITTPAGEPGPPITVPAGREPQRLIVRDLRKGSGRRLKMGDRVSVRYVGAFWDGNVVANAYAYEAPVMFHLGSFENFGPGLSRGMIGMRAGGKRMIVVPEQLIYYPDKRDTQERAPPGKRTSVYVIDLLKIG